MTSDTATTILRENTSSTRDALMERKRNEIQIWERTYEQTHDRKPTRKDVEKNERVRKMYREYKELLSGLTTKCTNSIQNNNNTKNNNGKGGDFENFHPTKEEYESDGDDEVIEATPPRKQQHIKQQHNKSFSKSSSLPSMVSSAEKKKNAAEAAADEASLFALKEEAKKKTKPLPVLPPPPPPSLVMRMKSNNNKGIIAGDFSSSSSFATIANKQKKKTCYEPLLCEGDERNRAKERFGALKRREMHAMENVSLTNALKEDFVVQPRKKKKLVVREEKRVVVGRAAAEEEEEEIEKEKEDGNSVTMMREKSEINNILSKTADDGGAKTTTTKLPPTFSPPKKTAAQIRAEHAKRFPEVGVAKKTAKFRGVSEHSRRKTYKAPRRRAGSAKRPPKVYTRDAARSGGSKHLNVERRERNAKGKTGKFSVGEGDDDLYSSKSKYDDDNDEDDIEKNKLDALAAEKRKKLEELNDDTLQKYIADVRECLSPFAEKKGVQSMDDTNDDDDDNDDETAVLKEKLRLVLERGFGFPVFKPGQIDVILRVLRGANTLALLPTGAGKSLTYQLPALLLPGVTLVISPLLALMSDQMRGLPPALKGACLRSDASYEKTEETLEEVKSGNVSVLFVSPERLLNEKFLCALRECPNGVSLACIDEAHCVSEWSHNFRPAYHRLGSILFNRVMRSGMNNNNGKTFPVLALTATATKKTEMSLRETLNIAPENALRNDAVRDNLSLSVIRVPSCSRNSTLLHFLQKDHPKGAAIVYVAFKNEAESVANYLKVQGVVARPYHAGLDKSERHRTQMQFQENKVRVIVATVAFGMGLDKPDVRYVINYALPRSPEAYIQQCGRAGRDGNEAHCLTFLDPEDYLRSRSLTHADGCDVTSIRDLMEIVFLGNGDVLKPKTTQKKKKKQVSEEVFRDEDDDIEKRKTDYDAYGNWIPKLGRIKPDVIAPVIDVKLEAIETALSCLELWGRDAQSITSPGSRDVKLDEEYSNLLRVLPDFRSTCEIRFFGRDPKEIAKQSTLVDAILKLCPEPKADGARIFDICKAAFLSNCSLDEVAFQLKALRDNREAGYEIRDRALGFEILRDPPKGDKLRKLAFDLTKRLDAVEKGSVGKLDALYAALDYAADAEADDVQGARLRESLKWYLNASEEEEEEEVEEVEEGPSGGEEDVPVRRVAEGAKRPKCVLTEKRMLVADIREILTHRRDGKVGGADMLRARAVARILHGIGSPKYPAAEWRRGSSAHLWERHRDVDFYTVVEMCNAEILRVRGVVPTSDY
jgi:ATP-dependent DNA helicase Q4